MTETLAATTTDLEQKVLEFPEGIPGFPSSRRFVLTELSNDGSFQLLRSLDEEHVSMVVSVPWHFFPDYMPDLSDEQQRELGLSAPEDAIVFCPVTLDGPASSLYVNLLGPFIINARTRQGRQVILDDLANPLRAVLLVDDEG